MLKNRTREWAKRLAAAPSPSHRNYTDPMGPRYSRFSASAPPRSEIRTVTFNIRYAKKIDRAIELFEGTERLKHADLIFLQEMDEVGVARIADAMRMNFVYFPATVHPHHERDFGNAILSRWRIVDDKKVILPHISRLHRTQRIAVAGTILVGAERVRTYSVHLATGVEMGPKKRRDQVRAVIADAEAGGHDRVIIGGDLNSRYMGELFQERGFLWPTRRFQRTPAYLHVDHIFLRGLRLRDQWSAGHVSDNLGSSDHRPVWAVVSIDEPGREAEGLRELA